ncbi:MAG TPA: SDR family NAD(P)-dependent oxidoreductase [Actinomycetota bacterium]|nr:SDR family NAD(P)-dependent oxidoreductase [Actinomycetota bacterium]
MAWQRALITGSSAGIGEAFARELAAHGTDLVLVARREPLLKELAVELERSHGVSVEVLPADLTDADQCRAVERRLSSPLEPIDLLVNNAGGGDPGAGAFVAHDRDAVEKQAILNALSVLRLTHAALTSMKEQGRGNVIQVSAGVGFYPTPWGATYAASKAFVNSFSQAVDFELGRGDVRVTSVCPGFTRTEAPARLGFSEDNVPRFLWTDPETVVAAALEGAASGKTLVSPTIVNQIASSVGMRVPKVMLKMAGRFRPLRESRS